MCFLCLHVFVFRVICFELGLRCLCILCFTFFINLSALQYFSLQGLGHDSSSNALSQVSPLKLYDCSMCNAPKGYFTPMKSVERCV
jgi:hypothetical protein